jgi:hypothetical protein
MLEYMAGIDQFHAAIGNEGEILDTADMVDVIQLKCIDMEPPGNAFGSAA